MENPQAKVYGSKLILDGFVYHQSRKPAKGRCYWDCNRLRRGECTARAITAEQSDPSAVVIVYKQSEHEHPPDQEECRAEGVKYRYESSQINCVQTCLVLTSAKIK